MKTEIILIIFLINNLLSQKTNYINVKIKDEFTKINKSLSDEPKKLIKHYSEFMRKNKLNTNNFSTTSVKTTQNRINNINYKLVVNKSFKKTTCIQNDCMYCCINVMGVCGTKLQCNAIMDMSYYNNFYFICLIFTIFIFIVVKLIISHGKKENDEYEKLDSKTLDCYLNLFMHNQVNKTKFKV